MTSSAPPGDSSVDDRFGPTAGADYVAQKQATENFPVALRLLPAALRRDLSALYGVARAIDDVGDDAVGDRAALLAEYAADLRRLWSSGVADRPELAALAPAVATHDLSIEPFLNLVAANRLDQEQSTYPDWAGLRHYCTLSADPIGRMVLEITDSSTPTRIVLSDDVCTALQVLEHCQDVGEDRRRGRTYLPGEDLDRFGVRPAQLDAESTSLALRAAIAFQVARARALLGSGRPLVRELRGAARLAVAGYVAGGLATADALRRIDFDVLNSSRSSKPTKPATAGHAARLLLGRA